MSVPVSNSWVDVLGLDPLSELLKGNPKLLKEVTEA
jgi:hypothetical protein